MRVRSLNHSMYELQYHIVWGTKYRRKWLKPYTKVELEKSFKETEKKYPSLHIEALNSDQDHVHLQMEIPPNICIADAVRTLKNRSSLHMQKKFKFIREMYLEKDGIWSVGYSRVLDRHGRGEDPQLHRAPGTTREAPDRPVVLTGKLKYGFGLS